MTFQRLLPGRIRKEPDGAADGAERVADIYQVEHRPPFKVEREKID
jgi:hypothetical protein